MQFKIALVALAASLVSAQIDLSKIPTCALPPAVAALGSSGCAQTDITCICSSTSFLTSLLPAVKAACSADDLAKAESFAYNLCLTAGITITIPGSTSSTSVPPAAPTTSVPATSAPAAPSSTAPAVPVSSVAAGVSTVYVTVPCTPSSSAVVVPTTKASNVTTPATKTATPSAFTGAAAVSYASGATVFGGVMAALAVLL